MSRDTYRAVAIRLLVGSIGWYAIGMLAMGCTASTETKRGGPGEFCNGSDQECRANLICDRGVCSYPNQRHQVCQDVCARFRQCDADLSACSSRSDAQSSLELCYQDCLTTLESWGRSQTNTYRTCYQNMECSRIRSNQCPQLMCFEQLPEPTEAELETCEQTKEPIRTCYSTTTIDPTEQLRLFEDACRRRARTASDRGWETFKDCARRFRSDPDISGDCRPFFRCLNRELPLDADEQFPTSNPSPADSSSDAGTGSDSGSSGSGGGGGERLPPSGGGTGSGP